MRTVLRKNMIAHKKKNKLTAIIFALSLGCIIFLLTSASLQINLIKSLSSQAGSDIKIMSGYDYQSCTTSESPGMLRASSIDDVIRNYTQAIAEWSYLSGLTRNGAGSGMQSIKVGDLARLADSRINLRAINPSKIFDDSIPLDYHDPDTTLGISEQLYTARGSQGLGVPKKDDRFGVDPANYDEVLQVVTSLNITQNITQIAYEKRPLWTGSGLPNFIDDLHWGFTSLPIYTQMADASMDQVVLNSVFIIMHDPSDNLLRAEIIMSLKTAIDDLTVSVIDQYDLSKSSEDTLELLDTIFYVIIAIMMFLCFFALQGSMSANLYEQTKEIGILRAIGFTSWRICLLYFYEALLLVFASCLLGILIGVLVGVTMVMQQDLFLNQPFAFFFPWRQTLEIFMLSILCAFFSTFGPAYQLTRKQISVIFRMI